MEDEYSRIHSHVEFVLDPTKLDLHVIASNRNPTHHKCAHLKSGTEKFPSGSDLLRVFVTESDVEGDLAEHGAKRNRLKQLAVRVIDLLQYNLDDIEAILAPASQKSLLLAVKEGVAASR